MTKENKKLKTIGLVIAITLLGKVLGLVRDMLLGQTFGTGLEADALTTAIHLPRMFFDVVFASAVTASFIPVFTEVLQGEGEDSAKTLAYSFFTLVGMVGLAFSALGMAIAPRLVNGIYNFDPETAALTARLLQIIFPSIFFTGIAFSMVGILNAFGQFHIPAAMSIASNGILIVYFLFFVSPFGVYGAAVALLLGWAAQAIMQVPSLRKNGYGYRPRFRHPGIPKILKLMLPVMASTWVLPINMIVLVGFASGIPGGAASINLANGLYVIIAGIFVLSVTNVIFPEMSRLSAAGEQGKLAAMVKKTLCALLFLLIPMTVGLMALSTPLVRLLYEYQQFDADSTAKTASVLFFMSIGMVAFGVQNVLVRLFYAKKQGRAPLISGVVGVLVNALLCVLLIEPMGLAGLGLAHALSLIVATLVLLNPTEKLLQASFMNRQFFVSILKMLLAALVMGLLVVVTRTALEPVVADGVLGRLVLFFVPAGLGAGAYFVGAAALKIEEMNTVKNIIFRRGGTS